MNSQLVSENTSRASIGVLPVAHMGINKLSDFEQMNEKYHRRLMMKSHFYLSEFS